MLPPMVAPSEVVLEKYRVVRELRRARRGALLLGWYEALDAEVELAVFDEVDEDPTSPNGVLRQAERLRRMRDPVLTEVREVGLLEDGTPCVVLEPVTGRSLTGLLAERGPLPWVEAARVGEIVATALAAKHAAGITHGDLALEDVVIGETGVRLVAFGIGRAAGLATARTDLAALGAVVAEILSGLAVDRADPASARLVSPAGLPPIPSVLVDVVGEMLHATDPERPAATAIAARLADIVAAGRKTTLKSRD
jgi:serine/threonine protein kinase